ncbi:hypothetical protein BT96DRAFT_1009035 [Gymnopus androsaceus JB14]|uniref:Uncharacterized protein n=1 Tax=Gymnopus androsaceus JB14 TaxID=1447944 RepID=A0A6A4GDH0_9AGAR|nr:hypothetical protein BT96DRAFT_1009035 [Gymnopus androsaceus JB14]
MPLPPSPPSSESGIASCGYSPRSDIDFSAFEPCTRPPSPYLHPNTAQGPIATKSSGERAPIAVTKQFSHPVIAVLDDSQSPKPCRISKLASSLTRDSIPALRQSSATTPSLLLSHIEPPTDPKTLAPLSAPTTHEEVPNLTTDSDTNGSTITTTSTSTTTAVAGNSGPGDTEARARTLVTHQLMSLLCAKLGDALAENNYMDISAIASRGVEALGLLL